MGFFTDDKPYTAITASINQLLGEKTVEEFEPEIQLPGLLESIKIQGAEGATEAARAIRKKLKYGTPTVQYKALVLLELLVSNGGKPLTPLYNDTKLLDRLKVMISDDTLIPRVRKKVIAMVAGWKSEFSNDPRYSELVSLHKYAKNYYKSRSGGANQPVRRQVPQFMDDSADEFSDSEYDRISQVGSIRRHGGSVPGEVTGTSNAALDQAYEIPDIDLRKAGPEIDKILAAATSGATLLKNQLSQLNRSRGEIAMDNDMCAIQFEKCRQIRRKVLRYLQVISEGEYLGLLIHANDELVEALQKYSDYSKPETSNPSNPSNPVANSGFISENSDDDDDDDDEESNAAAFSDYESEEDDEDNPFADRNKV
ncbi:Lsb5 protein [Saccharomycopsis crataegensis]|uniref:Lsb5 protein n=1 Tax=Saccharomycopsis crataegensis TaxID=43959 RepID=A0AAV5QF42_9ASCO|nr:Lsb5 protein [Saccharomycopsis crataegensis]